MDVFTLQRVSTMKQTIFNSFFKEVYYTDCLPIKEYKKYWLISKYEDKVSERLLQDKKDLYKKADQLFTEKLNEIISQPNPLLKLSIPFGEYSTQPVVFGDVNK